MSQFRIAGGTVYDPANGIDGEVRDVCIDAGRIVADVPRDVTPGQGLDLHEQLGIGFPDQVHEPVPRDLTGPIRSEAVT